MQTCMFTLPTFTCTESRLYWTYNRCQKTCLHQTKNSLPLIGSSSAASHWTFQSSASSSLTSTNLSCMSVPPSASSMSFISLCSLRHSHPWFFVQSCCCQSEAQHSSNVNFPCGPCRLEMESFRFCNTSDSGRSWPSYSCIHCSNTPDPYIAHDDLERQHLRLTAAVT